MFNAAKNDMLPYAHIVKLINDDVVHCYLIVLKSRNIQKQKCRIRNEEMKNVKMEKCK